MMKDIVVRNGLVILMSGIGIVGGGWCTWRYLKGLMSLDKLVSEMQINLTEVERTGFVGRRDLILMFSESKFLIAVEIQDIRKHSTVEICASLLSKKDYTQYSKKILARVQQELILEEDAIRRVREHLGLTQQQIDQSVQHHSQHFPPSENKSFVEELSEKLLLKECQYYYQDTGETCKTDALSFLDFLRNQFEHLLENNVDIFKSILQILLISSSSDPNEILSCLYLLAYDLLYIFTGYSERSLKLSLIHFRFILKHSQCLTDINSSYATLQKTLTKFLQAHLTSKSSPTSS